MDDDRPLINICIAVIVGILIYDFINKSIFVVFIVVSIFAIFQYIFSGRNMMFICILMMIVSFLNTCHYYDYINNDHILKVHISDVTYKYYGEINSRRVEVKGVTKDMLEGNDYVVKGIYDNKPSPNEGVVGTIYVDSVLKCNNTFEGKISSINNVIYKKLKDNIGEKEASMVCSIAFGNEDNIDENVKDKFKQYGIIHVLSVSGFHMSIIYGTLNKLIGFYASTAISIIYVILTGMKVSSERAFVMMFLLFLGKKIKRNYDQLSAISFSAIAILILRPYEIYSSGFLLSYSATIGIIITYKKIRRSIYRLPGKIGDAISISLSSQIFSFPIAAMTVKDISLMFLLGNIILMPMMSIIIILGNISLLTLKIDMLFKVICMFIHISILGIQGALFLMSPLSIDCIRVLNCEVIIYIVLLMSYFFYKRGVKKSIYVSIPLILFFICSVYYMGTRISFISKGYNKCILVEEGFNKVLIHKDDKYNQWKDIERISDIDSEKQHHIIIGDNKIDLDNYMNTIYITSGDKTIEAIWKENSKKNKSNDNSSLYDIININDNSNIIKIRFNNVTIEKRD